MATVKGPKAFLLGIVGKVRLEDNGSITHLQKYSPLGFLITWPFCFHFWVMWKLQEHQDWVDPQEHGGASGVAWVPGTEQGIYFRTPGYRYDSDAESGMKWTWGYVGGHWD